MLLRSSKYFMLSFVYETIKQKEISICKLLTMLPRCFSNRDLFTIYTRDNSKLYLINGMICKRGMSEYAYFFFHYCPSTEQQQLQKRDESYWVYHEDIEVVKMDNWKEVIEFCLKNQLTPILVIYQEHQVALRAEMETEETQKEEDKQLKAIQDHSLLVITKEDYERYVHYCQSVEKDSILTYMNESDQASRLRPVSQIMKVPKKDIQDMISKLKTRANDRKSMMIASEGNEGYPNAEDLIENLQTMLGEDKSVVDRAKAIEEQNRSKWQCTKCYLYNVKNCYRCSRCNYFDYAMYQTLISKPLLNEGNKDDVNNKEGQYGMIITDTKESLKEGDNCWQCGQFNPFYRLKCKKCRLDIHLYSLGLKAEDCVDNMNHQEDSTGLTNNSRFKRVGLVREYYEEDTQEKHIAINFSDWTCKYCHQTNKHTSNGRYCKFCFKNNSLNRKKLVI